MKLLVRRALALLACYPLIVAGGCGNQGEGERCDPTNGSVDCDAGLYCKTVYVDRWHYICCPVSGAASSSACNASGRPPVDAGSDTGADDARSDGATDRAPDTTNDGSPEASIDRGALDTTTDRTPDNDADTSRDAVAEASLDTNGSDRSDAVSTPDQASDAEDETSIDAPEPDVVADTGTDANIDVSADGAPDTSNPIDAADVADSADAIADAAPDSAG